MSYPIGSQPTAPAARRPAAVTAAAALLAVMAAAGIGYGVAGLLSVQGITDRFRSAADAADVSGSGVERVVAALRIGVAVGLLIALVVAVLLVTLAIGIRRGSVGARIATWAVCAIGAFCGVCGLAIVVGQRLVPLSADSSNPDLLRAWAHAYPGWWLGLNAMLSAGQSVAYVVVALLLALPPANAFFRHRHPEPERSSSASSGEPQAASTPPGSPSASPKSPAAPPAPSPPSQN